MRMTALDQAISTPFLAQKTGTFRGKFCINTFVQITLLCMCVGRFVMEVLQCPKSKLLR